MLIVNNNNYYYCFLRFGRSHFNRKRQSERARHARFFENTHTHWIRAKQMAQVLQCGHSLGGLRLSHLQWSGKSFICIRHKKNTIIEGGVFRGGIETLPPTSIRSGKYFYIINTKNYVKKLSLAPYVHCTVPVIWVQRHRKLLVMFQAVKNIMWTS